MAAWHEEGCFIKKSSSYVFLLAKDYQNTTSEWRGAPNFSRYGREQVSEPAILLKTRSGATFELLQGARWVRALMVAHVAAVRNLLCVCCVLLLSYACWILDSFR